MMLKDKVAVIYGAGGAVGGAVARAFASEGAELFLTGRKPAPVEAVAEEIAVAGGSAEAATVDALDERAVDEHLQSVIDAAGRIDISFDAVGIPGTNLLGVPLAELDLERFALPITTYTASYFLTARLAARHMIRERIGGDHDRHHPPVADGLPNGGRLRPGDGRQGGTHSRAIRRARASGHSRGRSATAGHSRDRLAQGSLRASRQDVGNDVGAIPRAGRKQDPPATALTSRNWLPWRSSWLPTRRAG